MIIISDTSVITNLIQLEEIEILKKLFEEIIIPPAVNEEIYQIPSQKPIIESTPWIKTIPVKDKDLFNKLLDQLDKGEAEAIALSVELKADLLLIDEKKGRKIATEYGIKITGLIGILIEAKHAKIINKVKPLLDKLIYEIGFRINPKLYNRVLSIVDEDKK